MRHFDWTSSSFVRVLPIFLFLNLTGVEGSGCKTIRFLRQKSDYLRNHIIQTLTVNSQPMCRVMCYLSDSCLSYNFQESTGTCDINDSDEFQHPDDLIQKPGYLYMGTENGCQSKPCPINNTTCQANFTIEGGFNCLCPSGFTGPSCNKDSDECVSGAHNCSVYTRCENTRGSFKCIPLDGTRENPAKSCLNILKGGYSNGSGEYWLDPANTGNPIKALCDMTTDGGGWTIIKKLVQPTSTALDMESPRTYKVIKEYGRTDKNVVLHAEAISDIKDKMGFHQIHFYCRKVSVGRVVSIMTKNNTAGQAVIDFYTDTETPSDQIQYPTACGSFDRLPDDTSFLSQNCKRWGGRAGGTPVETNEWGGSCCPGAHRMSARTFQIVTPPTYGFEFYTYFLCDNELPIHSSLKVPPNVNDTWQVSVR